jgi:hypothetical protein
LAGKASRTASVLPASYPLSDPDEAGEDIWAQARTGARWQSHVDARHGPYAWRPLADGARFEVSLTLPAGSTEAVLEALPANEAAEQAMR